MKPNAMPVTLAAALEENARLRAELAQLRASARSDSVTDAITGLRNRFYFDLLFMDEQRRAHREGRTLTLLVASIDRLAECSGHEAEAVLKRAAETIVATLGRPGDMAFRIGADEFACLFVTTVERESVELAERMRLHLLDLAIAHPRNAPHAVATLSAGLTFLRPDQEVPLADACEQAGQALARARDSGGNAVSR